MDAPTTTQMALGKRKRLANDLDLAQGSQDGDLHRSTKFPVQQNTFKEEIEKKISRTLTDEDVQIISKSDETKGLVDYLNTEFDRSIEERAFELAVKTLLINGQLHSATIAQDLIKGNAESLKKMISTHPNIEQEERNSLLKILDLGGKGEKIDIKSFKNQAKSSAVIEALELIELYLNGVNDEVVYLFLDMDGTVIANYSLFEARHLKLEGKLDIDYQDPAKLENGTLNMPAVTKKIQEGENIKKIQKFLQTEEGFEQFVRGGPDGLKLWRGFIDKISAISGQPKIIMSTKSSCRFFLFNAMEQICKIDSDGIEETPSVRPYVISNPSKPSFCKITDILRFHLNPNAISVFFDDLPIDYTMYTIKEGERSFDQRGQCRREFLDSLSSEQKDQNFEELADLINIDELFRNTDKFIQLLKLNEKQKLLLTKSLSCPIQDKNPVVNEDHVDTQGLKRNTYERAKGKNVNYFHVPSMDLTVLFNCLQGQNLTPELMERTKLADYIILFNSMVESLKMIIEHIHDNERVTRAKSGAMEDYLSSFIKTHSDIIKSRIKKALGSRYKEFQPFQEQNHLTTKLDELSGLSQPLISEEEMQQKEEDMEVDSNETPPCEEKPGRHTTHPMLMQLQSEKLNSSLSQPDAATLLRNTEQPQNKQKMMNLETNDQIMIHS